MKEREERWTRRAQGRRIEPDGGQRVVAAGHLEALGVGRVGRGVDAGRVRVGEYARTEQARLDRVHGSDQPGTPGALSRRDAASRLLGEREKGRERLVDLLASERDRRQRRPQLEEQAPR